MKGLLMVKLAWANVDGRCYLTLRYCALSSVAELAIGEGASRHLLQGTNTWIS